ncbi:MAG: corrinoid protein [Thermodesulfobacteriota bacterium]
MFSYARIQEAVIKGESGSLPELVQEAFEAGQSAKDILNRGLIQAMDQVGQRMEADEMFIPEVLLAARAMTATLEILKPHLAGVDFHAAGKVVIGTVKGDLHDIGKNLVAMMLRSAGFEVLDLGTDVPSTRFVEAVKEKKAGLVCLSALLTTTMPQMRIILDELTEAGLRNQIKVLVGGAPVNQGFADKIGADGYAPDAGSAARLAKTLSG